MKCIAIVGNSGSGKSTFAQNLGKRLNREVIHLDKEYWTVGWRRRFSNYELWKKFQKKLVQGREWIIEGNYPASMKIQLDRADTIVLLDFPKWRCAWRAILRAFRQNTSSDKPTGTREKISWKFIKSILNYPQKQKRKLVESYRGKSGVFIVRNNRELRTLLWAFTFKANLGLVKIYS